ncbi:MAG: ATP-binding cassette domain-containing protein [Acidimicrobiales bacterium]
MTPLLSVEGLDVAYGQTQVLFGVDLTVERGEIVALLGTNGAGKSTILRAISGLSPVSAGSIHFDGRAITGSVPNTTARLGITQVPGGRGVFPTLTVADNMRAAAWLYRKDKERVAEATAGVLAHFPALERRWDTPAGNLSGGEQQMLSLGQAFLAQPALLMIDELSLGLAPTIVDQLLEIVHAIHRNGTTILVVEQSVRTALRLAERAVFLEKGEVRFTGPTAELIERTDILRAVYLRGAAAVAPPAPTNGKVKAPVAPEPVARSFRDAPAALVAERLCKRYGGVAAVDDVSFTLHQGEVLGVIGPNGAGKTTVFDLLSGFTPTDSGRVLLGDRDVTALPAHQRAALGLGRSFQDARLWSSLTVREAIAVATERTVTAGDPLSALLGMPAVRDSERRVAARVAELIDLLGVGAFRDKFIAELSTGSRRMVELACLIANEPRILLLDEPSSGIAQREAEALGPVLKRVQAYLDASILVIEHDMPLLTGLSDRLIALDTGRFVTTGSADEVLSHPSVVSSYLGEREAVGP